MYHFVRDLENSKFPRINALLDNEFVEQINFLNKNFNIISIDQCIDTLKSDESLPENSCVLTFDDGYIDHFNVVFPVLKKLKIQGWFFPPAEAILKNKVLDVNKIHFILANMHDKFDELLFQLYSLLEENRSLYSLKSNLYYFDKIINNKSYDYNRYDNNKVVFFKRMLQFELEENLRSKLVDYFFKKFVTHDEASFANDLYMNLEQIGLMSNEGMYVGSHSFSHRWLDKLNPDEQNKEINLSIDFLKKVNAPTKDWVMCYPYGAYNSSLINILKKKHCIMGLASSYGFAYLNKTNIFKLNRFDTNDFPPKKEFKL